MKDAVVAIIVAAGTASRYGSDKVLDEIGGKPAISRSLSTFAACAEVDRIVVVTRPDLVDVMRRVIDAQSLPRDVEVVVGGRRRQDSVAAGLNAAGNAGIAVVHDGARPLVTVEMIRATIDAIRAGADAALAAIPVADTLKRSSETGIETIDRASLYRAQTPQAFRADQLRSALARAEVEGREATDEATLIEEMGGRVELVPGDERNLKLTVPGDRAILEALVQSSEPERVSRSGIGYDVHRLVAGRPLVLGGVSIPHSHGLEGHSDADVVLHAICDAILGACALGDIGQHFPPSDDAFRGIDSLLVLQRVIELVTAADCRVVHIDAMVVAEAPRIAPHVPAMRERIATAAGLPPSAVSIKATTNEGLGFAGRQEGIAAMATATVLGPA